MNDAKGDGARKRLNAREVEEAGLSDWRMLFETLHARFRTGDFATGLKLVKKIGKAAEKADHHPDIELTYPRVDVRLSSHDVGGVTKRDVKLARKISDYAADLGAEAAPEELSVIELALDTPSHADVKDFWAAVLGYRPNNDLPDELNDPDGTKPTLWFQEAPDAHGEAPQRFHIDIRVPPEVAEDRVRKVLDAGGTLVSDDRAPTVWVLADKHGNKACITTWLGRVPGDEVTEGDAKGNVDMSSGEDDRAEDTGGEESTEESAAVGSAVAAPSTEDTSSIESPGTQTTGQGERGSEEPSAGAQPAAPPTTPTTTGP